MNEQEFKKILKRTLLERKKLDNVFPDWIIISETYQIEDPIKILMELIKEPEFIDCIYKDTTVREFLKNNEVK